MTRSARPYAVRILLAASLGLAATAPAAAVEIESDDDKTLYAMGLAMGRNLGAYELTDRELELFQKGLADAVAGGEPAVDLEAQMPKIRTFTRFRTEAAAQREKKASEAWLAEQADMEGASKSESGLIKKVLEPGSGPKPAASDTVKVHYHGTLRDGTVFDSSVNRGEPATFPLNRVVPCWTEALQTMQVGEKARVVCPSDIAYGDRGAPPLIKPGAALAFEVELIEIVTP